MSPHPLPTLVRARTVRARRPSRRGLLALLTLALLASGLGGVASPSVRRLILQDDVTVPEPRAIDVLAAFTDRTPVTVTLAALPEVSPRTTTADELTGNITLWRRMTLSDWNGVPLPWRERGIDAMFMRYQSMLANPRVWDAMEARDWDRVPQPIRTVAYREMSAYWAGYYAIGRRYGLAPGTASDTLAAIIMSESWFDHRAAYRNRDGSVDVGLGGASAFARTRLRTLHGAGLTDFSLADQEYFDPWKATRFAATWFSLMLDEAEGDLELAVRAYNRGIGAAGDPAGDRYLATVLERRARFIRNQSAPSAWAYTWARARDLERVAWPWTRRGGSAQDASAAARPPLFDVD